MIAQLGLNKKFTLLLSIVFLGGMIASGLALWQALVWKAQQEITSQGLILIEAMKAVRGYTDTRIKPILDSNANGPAGFIPETVPAFSARSVFENFRQYKDYGEFSYKEAALNPTNPRNKADNFEATLIAKLSGDRSIGEISGFRAIDGKDFFYIARPLAVTSQSCLSCHSTPEKAPKGLVDIYGSQGGFGWKLGDVNVTQIIYVPANEVYNSALRSFLLVMGIFSASFVVVILLINILLKRYVIEPVSVMGRLAQKIRNDEMTADDLASESILKASERADELGHLSHVFRDMAREVYVRMQDLKQQMQELRIEVDERKRQKDVEAIVESDFFKDLQAKADRMRKRQREDPKRTLLLPQLLE